MEAEQPLTLSAARLAVLVHKAIRTVTAGVPASSSQTATFVSQKLELRDEGGDKGRGFYAGGNIAPGELVLREGPHVFDASEDDFVALAAIHAIAAAEEGCELRAAPGSPKASAADAQAARWLSGVEGLSEASAVKGFRAAQNNGFSTTMPDVPENEPMFLFWKLCIFNHSCWPNCAVFRDDSTGMSYVLAIRHIEKKQELTIHYSDDLILLPKDLRRAFLRGGFGFDCCCDRCESEDAAAEIVDESLMKHADGRSDTWQEESKLLHEMRMAHASLSAMQKEDGKPARFAYRSFESWADALAAVEAAMPSIAAYGATTFWARHHARALRCIALEELKRDSAAFLALAEHAHAAWRLMPRYCDALRRLQKRLDQAKQHLPVALRPRLEEKAASLHGEGLNGLASDMAKLQVWLAQAGFLIRQGGEGPADE
eukprot:TRINITY_DN7415_c0_g2_i1.p1 TRINITY_DN7415_c0_g2~~TRINITY_DN7415_c0_g2_i1.p1  ORF type:complete len:480 (-),score=130.21 TRINITY_DN7415_c0_g2_i1:346-1632(-)